MEFLAEYKLKLADSNINFQKPQDFDDVSKLLTREIVSTIELEPKATIIGPKTVC